MKRDRIENRWQLCEFCKQIRTVYGSNHSCPEAIRIKREIEIEEEVNEEMLLFDLSKEFFWDDPRTKFYEYLAERERENE